jgi:hypothetical protein
VETDSAVKFHARPVPSSHKTPLGIVKSSKPLTRVRDRSLASDRRAEARARFEKQQRTREESKAAHAAAAEENRRVAEEAEVKNFRKQTQFRARPVPKRTARSAKAQSSKVCVWTSDCLVC